MSLLLSDFNFYNDKNKNVEFRLNLKWKCNEIEKYKILKLANSIATKLFRDLPPSAAGIIDIDISADILQEKTDNLHSWVDQNSSQIAKEIMLLFGKQDGKKEVNYKCKLFSFTILEKKAQSAAGQAFEAVVVNQPPAALVAAKPKKIEPAVPAAPKEPEIVAATAKKTAAAAAVISKPAGAIPAKPVLAPGNPKPALPPSVVVPKINIVDHTELVANLNGDLFLQATGMEGVSQDKVMRYAVEITKKKLEASARRNTENAANEVHQLSQFINQMERGLAVYDGLPQDASNAQVSQAVQRMQKTLDGLKIGAGLIVPGGWTGLPSGHAMYYEITKTGAQTFSFRVFNSGAGIQRHPGFRVHYTVRGQSEAQFADKKLSYIQLDNISTERMQNAHFWQAAFEIMTYTKCPTSGVPTNYTDGDLYEKLFPLLEGSLCRPNKIPNSHYIVRQESGTCTASGLKAVMAAILPEDMSGRVIHDMELTSLQELHGALNMRETDERTRNLLRKSASQLALHAVQRFESRVISLQELELINALTNKILNDVLQGEAFAKQRAEKQATILAYPKAADASFVYKPHLAYPASVKEAAANPVYLDWSFDWKLPPKDLLANLQGFEKLLDKNKAANHQIIFDHIFDILTRLPVPAETGDPFWSSIPQNEVQAVLIGLNSLSRRLHELDLPASQLIRLQLVYLKNLAITHKLASQCGIPKEMMEAKWGARLNSARLFDPILIKQHTDLNDYFTAISKKNTPWMSGPFNLLSACEPRGAIPQNEAEYAYKYFLDHRKEVLASAVGSLVELSAEGYDNYKLDDQVYATYLLLDYEYVFPKAYNVLKQSFLFLEFALKNKKIPKEQYTFQEFFKIGINRTNPCAGSFLFTNVDVAGQAADYDRDYQALEKISYQKNEGDLSFTEYREEVCAHPDIKNMKLAAQEKHELLWLAHTPFREAGIKPSELKIIRTLDYFDRHILRLEDHNMLCFFRQMVFSSNDLEVLLGNNPRLAERLVRFMRDGYRYYNEKGRVTGAVNVLYLANMLVERLRPLAEGNAVIKTALQRFEKEGIDSIHHQDIRDCLWIQMKASSSVDEKSAIYRQLFYWHMQNASTPAEFAKALPEIVASLAFISRYPPKHPLGHLDDATRHSPQLDVSVRAIAKDSKGLSAIGKRMAEYLNLGVFNWENVKWDVSQFPICKGTAENTSYELNLSQFTLSAAGKTAVSLPRAIIESVPFLKNFPNYQPENIRLSNGMYEFEDAKGLSIRISIEGIIQRQFKQAGPWYQYIDSSHLAKSIHSKVLIEKRTHWQSCSNSEVYLCNPGTTEITHVVKPGAQSGTAVVVDQQHPNDQLLVDLQHPLYRALSQCEEVADIHVWVDDKDALPKRLELPPLGLTFQMSVCKAPGEQAGKLRLKCDQVTGFWLADCQHVPALGSFKNYLVLQNAEGCIKIIIPRRKIQDMVRGGLTSSIQLQKEYPDNPIARLPSYLSYTLNAKGELTAAHEAGHLFHAYLIYAQGRYSEAQTSFREQGHKLKKYTARELQNFDWIKDVHAELRDNDPKSYAVYLTARALQLRNGNVHGGGKDINVNMLLYVYQRYLRLLPYIGELRLLPEEEKSIARFITIFQQDVIVLRRLKTLESAVELNELPEEPNAIGYQNLCLEFLDRTYLAHSIRGIITAENLRGVIPAVPPPELITRSENILSLKDLYAEAKKLVTADISVRNAVSLRLQTIAAFQEGTNRKQIYYFVAAVAKEPKKFPSWEELVKAVDVSWEEMVKAVDVIGLDAQNPITNACREVALFYKAFNKRASEFTKGLSWPWVLPDKEVASVPAMPPQVPGVPGPRHYPVLLPPLPPGQPLVKITLQLINSKQTLYKEGLEKTCISFQEKVNLLRHSNNRLRTQLLQFANKSIPENASVQSRIQHARHRAAQIGGQTRPFTMESVAQELSYVFLRNSPDEIKKRNPNLDDKDIEQLRLMLVNYYEHVTAEHAMLRQERALRNLANCLAKADPRAKEDVELDGLIEKAVQELSLKPMHSAKEHPKEHLAFLVFEASTGLSLRKDQVDCILRLVQSNFSIEQMVMGAGKSKVILPILALLQADGKTLPIIITPSPLFDTAAKDLRKSVWDAFNRRIHTLHFERNTEFTVKKLSAIYDYLLEIQSQRECLMMTSKSLQCLNLKLKSAIVALMASPGDVTLRRNIAVLQKILRLIKADGKAIIDEPHLVLDTRLQVNFGDGRKMAIDNTRRQITALIYKELFSDQVRKMIGSHPLQDFGVTDDHYHRVVKLFMQNSLLAQEPFKAYMDTLQKAGKDHIDAYLRNAGNDTAEKFVKDSPLAEAFALLKEQLNHILPMTLRKRYCVDYGPSQKNAKDGLSTPLAIPYNGNNSPVESSEFLSPDILMNLTIQMWWHKGISALEIKRCLKQLQTDAIKEGGSFERTASFQAFRDLCGNDLKGIKFLDFTMADCEQIAARINASRISKTPDLFLDYVVKHILVNIRIQELTYTSNALDLVRMCKSAIGFTGTPWNSDTYAECLSKNTNKRPEIDAAVMKLMQEKISQDKAGIRVMAQSTYPGMLADLIRPDDDLLIDAGAALNTHSNETVANDILKLLGQRRSIKKGVVFSLKNKLVVLEKTDNGTKIVPLENSLLKPNERFTYYDQLRATGVDIPQHPLARGSLTIGKGSNVRDTVQGAYRLRELPKKQGLSLVITPEANMMLRNAANLNESKPLSFEDVAAFLKSNQESQLQAHLKIAVKQKIDTVVRQRVLNYFLKVENYNEAASETRFRRFLVSQQGMSIWDSYGAQEQMGSKGVVLKKMIDAALAQIDWTPALKEAAREEIIAEVSGIVDLLPNELSTHSSNLDAQGEVEKEQEGEKEMEQEINAMAQSQALISADESHMPGQWCTEGFFLPGIFTAALYSSADNAHMQELSESFKRHKQLAFFSPVMEGLIAESNRRTDSTAGLHQITQIPEQYVLYIRNKKDGKMRLMLLDALSDFPFFWTALSRQRQKIAFMDNNPEVELCLCDLQGSIIQHDSSIDIDNPRNSFMQALNDRGIELRVRAKLGLGELSFSKEEIPHLEKIMKMHGKVIGDYYRTHIFRMYPQKASASRHSPLDKII